MDGRDGDVRISQDHARQERLSHIVMCNTTMYPGGMAAGAKKPLQIYLQPDQERILRALATRERVSLAELIRRSIDRYVMDLLPPEQDPSLGLIGLGHSGRADLSARHDELVAEQANPPMDR